MANNAARNQASHFIRAIAHIIPPTITERINDWRIASCGLFKTKICWAIWPPSNGIDRQEIQQRPTITRDLKNEIQEDAHEIMIVNEHVGHDPQVDSMTG